MRWRITDTIGRPIFDIDLDVFDTAGNFMEATARSDTNGDYMIGPFVPGDYVLRADFLACLMAAALFRRKSARVGSRCWGRARFLARKIRPSRSMWTETYARCILRPS